MNINNSVLRYRENFDWPPELKYLLEKLDSGSQPEEENTSSHHNTGDSGSWCRLPSGGDTRDILLLRVQADKLSMHRSKTRKLFRGNSASQGQSVSWQVQSDWFRELEDVSSPACGAGALWWRGAGPAQHTPGVNPGARGGEDETAAAVPGHHDQEWIVKIGSLLLSSFLKIRYFGRNWNQSKHLY